jgi:hypothetical protein
MDTQTIPSSRILKRHNPLEFDEEAQGLRHGGGRFSSYFDFIKNLTLFLPLIRIYAIVSLRRSLPVSQLMIDRSEPARTNPRPGPVGQRSASWNERETFPTCKALKNHNTRKFSGPTRTGLVIPVAPHTRPSPSTPHSPTVPPLPFSSPAVAPPASPCYVEAIEP